MKQLPREIGQILLARFNNPDGLKNVGNNFYKETIDSGEPIVEIPGKKGYRSSWFNIQLKIQM